MLSDYSIESFCVSDIDDLHVNFMIYFIWQTKIPEYFEVLSLVQSWAIARYIRY